MRQHADAAALAAYPGGTAIDPSEADFYLKRASKVVDELLVGVVYDVDTDKLPTDTDVAEAMSDATCAIALQAKADGTLTPGGSSQQWSSISIGSVSLSGPTSDPLVVLGLSVPTDAILSLVGIGERFVWVKS